MSLLNRLPVLLAGAVVLFGGSGGVALAKRPNAIKLPKRPVGTFAQQDIGNPTAVAVAGHYAYMTNACGIGCYGPLDVIDVSAPKKPRLIGTTPLSWGTAGIAVKGHFAYTTGYSANPNFLRMVDVSNPAQPFSAAAFTLTGVHPQAVAVDGRRAYMVDYGSDRLEVIDVSDAAAGQFDPELNSSPISLPWVGGEGMEAGPSSIALRGRTAYVVNAVAGSVQVIDLRDPKQPAVLSRVSLGARGDRGTSYSGIAVSGAYAYVADANANVMRVLKISNPGRPTVVASARAGRNPVAIAVRGSRAYVVNKGSGTVQAFDIRSPRRPRSLGTMRTGAAPSSIALSGRHAFVSTFRGRTLEVFDVGG